ncbi:hypothetical protein OPV22_000190 [Ensete ventricosum]|uniref:Uncharacterized protein n=1 Tax=Ensete ventricosum TaxID=4639 RepID=A0AAV8RPL9_ENSVE|nr:hypothetical protein OPV22_000190 [Ensete ventricosum]
MPHVANTYVAHCVCGDQYLLCYEEILKNISHAIQKKTHYQACAAAPSDCNFQTTLPIVFMGISIYVAMKKFSRRKSKVEEWPRDTTHTNPLSI